MARSMDSILSDVPTVHDLPDSTETVEKVEAAPETTPSEKPEPQEKAEAAKAEQPHDSDDDQEGVPDDLSGLKRALAAARGDKRKARKQWQDTEKALAELRGKLSVMERPPQAQQQPKPDDLSEEEFFGKGPEAIKRYVESKISAVRDEQRTTRLNYSEAAARERHEDFQDAFDKFKEFAKASPHLWQQMAESHDPGEFVYRTGKTYSELEGVDSVDAFRKKIEAEVRAKIETEKQQETSAPPTSAPPKSIATARGSGVSAAQPWTGPRPLKDLFG